MDPNKCLEQIRDDVSVIFSVSDTETAISRYESLAEHTQALDEWLSKGGFLPQLWGKSTPAHWQAVLVDTNARAVNEALAGVVARMEAFEVSGRMSAEDVRGVLMSVVQGGMR